MSGPAPDHSHDRRVEEVVRIASGLADDDLMDLPPDEVLRIVMERGRGPQENGGAAIAVPAPHTPGPHDPGIALSVPVEDVDE